MCEVIAEIYANSGIEKIVSLYHDPRRNYHGHKHINDQISLITKLTNHKVFTYEELQILILTSVYHDAIYEGGMPSGFNEAASKELFLKLNKHLPERIKTLVSECILATASFDSKKRFSHLNEEDEKLLQLFLDIDLYSFQKSDEEVSPMIASEFYALNPWAEKGSFEKGRWLFLRSMFKRTRKGFYYLPYEELKCYFNNEVVFEQLYDKTRFR